MLEVAADEEPTWDRGLSVFHIQAAGRQDVFHVLGDTRVGGGDLLVPLTAMIDREVDELVYLSPNRDTQSQ